MNNDELFGTGYHPLRAMQAIDERDEDCCICGQCGETCSDPPCECCRQANDDEMRAAMHTANTLAFIQKSLGLR